MPSDPSADSSQLSWAAPLWTSTVTDYVVVYKQASGQELEKWGVYSARDPLGSGTWPGGQPALNVHLNASPGACGDSNSALGWNFCPLPRGLLVNGTSYTFKVFARTASGLGLYSTPVTWLASEGPGLRPTLAASDWGADPNEVAGQPPGDPATGDPDGPGPIVYAPEGPSQLPGVAAPPQRSPTAAATNKSAAKPGAVSGVRFRPKALRWKAPAHSRGAHYRVRVMRKGKPWSDWRSVGAKLRLPVGVKVVAVCLRAVTAAGAGPVTTVTRASSKRAAQKEVDRGRRR